MLGILQNNIRNTEYLFFIVTSNWIYHINYDLRFKLKKTHFKYKYTTLHSRPFYEFCVPRWCQNSPDNNE